MAAARSARSNDSPEIAACFFKITRKQNISFLPLAAHKVRWNSILQAEGSQGCQQVCEEDLPPSDITRISGLATKSNILWNKERGFRPYM